MKAGTKPGNQLRELGVRREILVRRRPADPVEVAKIVAPRQACHVVSGAEDGVGVLERSHRNEVGDTGGFGAQGQVRFATAEIEKPRIGQHLEPNLPVFLSQPSGERSNEIPRHAGRRGETDETRGLVVDAARRAGDFAGPLRHAPRRRQQSFTCRGERDALHVPPKERVTDIALERGDAPAHGWLPEA